MALLERNQVEPPMLAKATVSVPGLGGDVVVCGLLLSDRLEMSAINAALRELRPGETEAQARARVGKRLVADTLARCVVLADGQPLWSAQEWDVFGAKHPQDVLDLFSHAQRLNGQDVEDVEKN